MNKEMHDIITRDRYRHVIEDVARGSTARESGVAREAVILAQAAAARLGTTDRTAHVGYYLIDNGRQVLERAVRRRLSWQLRVSRASRHLRLFLYIGPIMLLTALATSAVPFPFG